MSFVYRVFSVGDCVLDMRDKHCNETTCCIYTPIKKIVNACVHTRQVKINAKLVVGK